MQKQQQQSKALRSSTSTQQINLPSKGSDQPRKTRSTTSRLPKGSRNEQVFNNLMRGISSRTAPQEQDEEVPNPVESDDPSSFQCSTHSEIARGQGVCETENEPLRQDIINVTKRIESLENTPQESTPIDQSIIDALRRDQQKQIDSNTIF